MTTEYKILGQAYIGLTSYEIPGEGNYYGGGGEPGVEESLLPVIVYTVPPNTQAIITSIFIVNHDTFSRTYDLAVVPSGETLGIKHHIKWDHPLAAYDFDMVSSKLSLFAGTKLVVLPSSADKIGVTIFGLEI